MSEKHGLFDALKHIAFEEEPAKPASDARSPAFSKNAPSITVNAASGDSPPLDIVKSPDDESYRSLLQKTDFENTDIARALHKFLDPLKGISDAVMSPAIKFKSAVLQAKAQGGGVTDASILATFDTLRAALQKEDAGFAASAQQFAAREVAGRQDRIGQISGQIAQLQQQLAQLSTELAEARARHEQAQNRFSAAVRRRSAEIEQQRAHYADLLKE